MHKSSQTLAARKSPDDWRCTSSCDGRVVKALDLKSNGSFPRRFKPCSQRRIRHFCSLVKSQLSANLFNQNRLFLNTAHQNRKTLSDHLIGQLTRHKSYYNLAARKSPDDWRFRSSCDGRVVKALDLKNNGKFPRRFESF